jgi:hypothetical protein
MLLQTRGPIRNGHIPSAAERELSGIKEIQRGKTFLEARTAVQKHIEKMLVNNNSVPTNSNSNNNDHISRPISAQFTTIQEQQTTPIAIRSPLIPQFETKVKHSMHGVSHAIPGDFDDDFEKPPPVHYGVDAAIRSGSVALKVGNLSRNSGNFFSDENLTTIVKEPSLARGQSQESVINLRVTSSVDRIPPQPSPQGKKIIPLRNQESRSSANIDSGKNFFKQVDF